MIRKYSILGAKVTYRLFIIGTSAFFLAASAHNMLSSFFDGPAPCGRPVVTDAKAAR